MAFKLYRSKPAEMMAMVFDPSGPHKTDLPEFIRGVSAGGADNWNYQGCRFFVTTASGAEAEVFAGDYIAQEPDGRGHYPIKPDIFETRWEHAGSRAESGTHPADCKCAICIH